MSKVKNHIDLFSGLGLFALAWKWCGGTTKQFVEIDPFCRKILNKNFPGVPIHDDIKTFTIDTYVNLCYNKLSQYAKEVVDMGAKKKDFDAAVNMYNGGLSIQNVADFYGISRQAMWMILKRRGCQFRDHLKYQEDNHFFRGGSSAPDRIHNIVELAVEKGILIRPVHCEKCGTADSKINGHHADYNKPLEVDWLCSKCHFDWHEKNVPIELKIDFPAMTHTEIASRGGSRKEVTTDEILKTIDDATRTFLLTGGFP